MSQCAALLYPYIADGTISHGKTAKILGIHKMELIQIYGKNGLFYFDMTMDELDEDISTFKPVRA